MSAESNHDEVRRSVSGQLKQILRSTREACWSPRASEMKAAAFYGNTRKLFQLIRATGHRKTGASETICEADGSPIANLQRRLDRWAEYFHSQFNWPSPSTDFPCESTCPPWVVTLDASSEAEVCFAIGHLRRFKAAGSDGLPPELFMGTQSSLASLPHSSQKSGMKERCLFPGASQLLPRFLRC